MLRRLSLSVIACLAIVTANAEAKVSAKNAGANAQVPIAANATINEASCLVNDAKNAEALPNPNLLNAANELAINNDAGSANLAEAMAAKVTMVINNANGINDAGHTTNAAPRLIS